MSRLGIGVKAVEELYIHKFFFIVARVHARLCHLHSPLFLKYYATGPTERQRM